MLNKDHTIKLTTSWDDGAPSDLKLAELLMKYSVSAIFYIPIKNSFGAKTLSASEIYNLSKHFEIGGHTYNHVKLTTIDKSLAKKEIEDGKHALEDIIQTSVKSFCYPCGLYNNNIVKLVKDVGFLKSRSARLLSFNDSSSDDFIQHPNLHFFPHSRIIDFLHVLKQGDAVSFRKRLSTFSYSHLELFKAYNTFAGNQFHLWGHSWEVEKYNLYGKLEELFKFFSNR